MLDGRVISGCVSASCTPRIASHVHVARHEIEDASNSLEIIINKTEGTKTR